MSEAVDPSSVRAIVTIDGIDGSGKSTFARRLVEVLGPKGVLLSVDDFRRPVDWSRTDRSELWLYYHQRYDLGALDHCLQAFRDGKPGCSFRGFDGAKEQLGEEHQVSFRAVEVAVVEGVFVARLHSAVDALAVYIDIPQAEAARRVRERDLSKGRSREEVDRRIEQRYFPAHERYVAEQQPRDRAAILLDNRDPRAPRVMRARFPSSPGWVTVRAALERLLDDSPHA
jgi:uridine kinase